MTLIRLCKLFVSGWIISITVAASPANAWLFGKDHPSKAEIAEIVSSELPEHLELVEVEISSQETRNGLIEYSESRVRISVAPREHLYSSVERIEGGVTVIEMVLRPSDTASLFALLEAKATGEGWDGHVVWDDKKQIKNLGNVRSDFGTNSLEKNSPAYIEHLAKLKHQGEQEEQKQIEAKNALLQLKHSVSGIFTGMVVCGRTSFEIDTLQINAVNGTGTLVGRKLLADKSEWTTTPMEVAYNEQDQSFRTMGKDWRLNITFEAEEAVFSVRNCEAGLYHVDKVPETIRAARNRERSVLATLAPGPISAKAFGTGRNLDVNVEVLEVFDRGFSMRIDHPMYLNGRYAKPASGWRSVSTIKVRFSDAPSKAVRTGRVEGRGDPMLFDRCGFEAEVTDIGTLRFQAIAGYMCDSQLELTP